MFRILEKQDYICYNHLWFDKTTKKYLLVIYSQQKVIMKIAGFLLH